METAFVKKIQTLSKDELVEILLSYTQKYPDLKRDLMARLEGEQTVTFNTIKQQIAQTFPSIESPNYSPSNIAKQLRTILDSGENFSQELQIKVYWAVIDRILKELNRYGMDDAPLEDIAIDTMEKLITAFTDPDI
jgi:hypothetical protein